jgi:hypothetical protein
LRKNGIGDEGIKTLSKAVMISRSMVNLNVASCDFTPKGAKDLFDALSVNKSVIDLDVSSLDGINRNKFGLEGAKSFEQYLKSDNLL